MNDMNAQLSQWLALFGQNIATGFVAIALLGAILAAVEGERRRFEPALVGLMFGVAGLISMLNPVSISDGIILDMRNVFALVGGMVGGPIGAAIAGVIIAAYRAHIGGAGLISGLGSIVSCAVFGGLVGWHYRERIKEFSLPLFG